MKPTKNDFQTFVRFGENIKDNLINIHINDAFKFDIKPKLLTLATDILAYTPENPTPTKPELKAFYENFILEWWIRLAYKRFYQVHGDNVNQYGIQKMKDPQGTFDQLTATEKAVTIKQIDHDASICYSDILRETWTFDGATYRKPCNDNSESTGINAIG